MIDGSLKDETVQRRMSSVCRDAEKLYEDIRQAALHPERAASFSIGKSDSVRNRIAVSGRCRLTDEEKNRVFLLQGNAVFDEAPNGESYFNCKL